MLDDWAKSLNFRFHTVRIFTKVSSVISVPSVVENAICVLPLDVPAPNFVQRPDYFVPCEYFDRWQYNTTLRLIVLYDSSFRNRA